MTRAHFIDGWRIEVSSRDGVPRVISGARIARLVAVALRAAAAPNAAAISVVLTNDDELAELNSAHLGHEGPTDVLSFPLLPPEAFPPHAGRLRGGPGRSGGSNSLDGRPSLGEPGPSAPVGSNGPAGSSGPAAASAPAAAFVLPPGSRIHLGDIAVSIERAIAQAAEGRGGQTSDVRWSAADELALLLTHGTLHVCGWDHALPEEEAAMRALERQLLAQPAT